MVGKSPMKETDIEMQCCSFQRFLTLTQSKRTKAVFIWMIIIVIPATM